MWRIAIAFMFLIMSVNHAVLAQQSSSGEAKVVEVYGADYATQMKNSNAGLYDFLVFSAENGFQVSTTGGKDVSDIPDISAAPLANTKLQRPVVTENNINVLYYDLHSQPAQRQYYRLGNTGKLIVLLSKEELMKQFNEQRSTD